MGPRRAGNPPQYSSTPPRPPDPGNLRMKLQVELEETTAGFRELQKSMASMATEQAVSQSEILHELRQLRLERTAQVMEPSVPTSSVQIISPAVTQPISSALQFWTTSDPYYYQEQQPPPPPPSRPPVLLQQQGVWYSNQNQYQCHPLQPPSPPQQWVRPPHANQLPPSLGHYHPPSPPPLAQFTASPFPLLDDASPPIQPPKIHSSRLQISFPLPARTTTKPPPLLDGAVSAQSNSPPASFCSSGNTSGLSGLAGITGQSNFGQSSVAQGVATVPQPIPAISPIGTLTALPQMSVAHVGTTSSIQYGISSIPVIPDIGLNSAKSQLSAMEMAAYMVKNESFGRKIGRNGKPALLGSLSQLPSAIESVSSLLSQPIQSFPRSTQFMSPTRGLILEKGDADKNRTGELTELDNPLNMVGNYFQYVLSKSCLDEKKISTCVVNVFNDLCIRLKHYIEGSKKTGYYVLQLCFSVFDKKVRDKGGGHTLLTDEFSIPNRKFAGNMRLLRASISNLISTIWNLDTMASGNSSNSLKFIFSLIISLIEILSCGSAEKNTRLFTKISVTNVNSGCVDLHYDQGLISSGITFNSFLVHRNGECIVIRCSNLLQRMSKLQLHVEVVHGGISRMIHTSLSFKAAVDLSMCAIIEFSIVATLNVWLNGNLLCLLLKNKLEKMSLLFADKFEKMEGNARMMLEDFLFSLSKLEGDLSFQLAANISPTMDITPDDLLILEAGISCFQKLCDVALYYYHVESLLALLGEIERALLLCRRVLFPCFISELVKGDHQLQLFLPYDTLFVVGEAFTNSELLQHVKKAFDKKGVAEIAREVVMDMTNARLYATTYTEVFTEIYKTLQLSEYEIRNSDELFNGGLAKLSEYKSASTPLRYGCPSAISIVTTLHSVALVKCFTTFGVMETTENTHTNEFAEKAKRKLLYIIFGFDEEKLQKLAPKYFGPYQVIKKIGKVAYKLLLPPTAKIHPVFHVSRLKKVGSTVITSPDLPPMFESAKTKWYPAKIIDRRIFKKKNAAVTKWLVQWKNTNEEDATWEDPEEFMNRFPGVQSNLNCKFDL
ncbi:hypothetical protein ABKV19_017005 [Rosa sericea]